MTSPKKRTASRAGGAKKVRLSRAEATKRMLEATSQLLVEYNPSEVTVVRICERAEVHVDYVTRYFGSRDELLYQAITYASTDVFLSTESKDISRLQIILEENEHAQQFAKARARTIAYLLGCGVEPERFQPDQKQLIDSVLLQSNDLNISDRAKKSLVLVGMLALQGMYTFDEVNDMTDQEKSDVITVLGYLGQSGELIDAALALTTKNKPEPKKRK